MRMRRIDARAFKGLERIACGQYIDNSRTAQMTALHEHRARPHVEQPLSGAHHTLNITDGIADEALGLRRIGRALHGDIEKSKSALAGGVREYLPGIRAAGCVGRRELGAVGNTIPPLENEVVCEQFKEVVNLAREKGLLSEEHFSIDGTLIQAWASQKSYRPKNDDDGDDDNGVGRNKEVNFHGEKRLA